MADPVKRILGKDKFYDDPNDKTCWSCGNKKAKRRFTGGNEGVLCNKCWAEAEAFEKEWR